MSEAPTTHHFIVHAPDKTEEGTYERRLSVRAIHLEAAKQNIENGLIRVGGFMLSPESIASPAAERKLVGSAFICKAENIEQVRKAVENDVYYTAGVWDREKISILPFVPSTPLP